MPRPALTIAFLLLALFAIPASASTPARSDAPTPLTAKQRAYAARLLGEALIQDDAYEGLRELCDRIGHRVSGSAQLDSAIVWAITRLKRQGFKNVRAEKVMVPAWVRGAEKATLLEPVQDDLTMLGIGMSVGTPAGGITADVVCVSSFEELDAMGAAGVRGRIVLFDVPFTSYGETVRYRSQGASRAARLGAVAALVRSVGPASLDTPHTGALSYTDTLPRIPAACLSLEDAARLHRMTDAGMRVRVRLEMAAHQGPDVESANVVAEIPGTDLAHEVVVLGGHLDSWDVGQGAQDDGAGCLITMEAAHLIHRLGLKPRRTLRVVLWTNEENGTRGARAYRDAHRATLGDHVAAIESDSGNGPALGFQLDLRAVAASGTSAADSTQLQAADRERARALAILESWSPLLEPVAATRMTPGGAGADVSPLCAEGVVGLGVNHDTSRYFDIHHTEADTFDKIDRTTLNRNVAAVAILTYLLADSPDRLRARPAAAKR